MAIAGEVKFPRNPYDFAYPVMSEQLFAGREEELADISYYLDLATGPGRPISLVLTGARSAGKTSLLNQIDTQSRARHFVVARVNLNEGDATPLNFFYKVYDAILKAAVDAGAFAGRGGPTYREYRRIVDGISTEQQYDSDLYFPSHFAAASVGSRNLSEPTLQEDLITIAREIRTTCVILFDECDVLAASRIELEMLRNIFMGTPGYLLALVGTPNMFPMLEDVFSPVIRQFKKIVVRPFEDVKDTTDCVNKPLKTAGLDPAGDLGIHPATYSEIHHLTKGRPYEIQLLCHFMYKRVERGLTRSMALSIETLDDVRQELEVQGADAGHSSIEAIKSIPRKMLRSLSVLTLHEGTLETLAAEAKLRLDLDIHPGEWEPIRGYFVDLGLLTIDGEGVTRFKGDQFDEIYVRYFAASVGEEALTIGRFAYPGALRRLLHEHIYDCVDGPSSFIGIHRDRPDAVAKAVEQLSTGPTAQDAEGELSELALRIYRAVYFASLGGLSLKECEYTLHCLGATAHMTLVTLESNASSGLGNPSLNSLLKRAESLGGQFSTVDRIHKSPTLDTLKISIKKTATPHQRAEIADFHIAEVFEHYQAGDYQCALREAMIAQDFRNSSFQCNQISHLYLCLGDYTAAIENSNNALDYITDGQSPKEKCLAYYDRAVGYLMVNEIAAAKTSVLLAKELWSDELSDGAYLVIPVRDKDTGVTSAAASSDIVSLSESIDQLIGILDHLAHG